MDYEVRNKKTNTDTKEKRACPLSPKLTIELSDFFLIPQRTVHLDRQRVLSAHTLLTLTLALLYDLSPFPGSFDNLFISRISRLLLSFEIVLLNIGKPGLIPVRFMYLFVLFFRDCSDGTLSLFRTRMVRGFCCCHMEKMG